MITLIMAIYDAKTEAFMQPFFTATKGSAIRSFADAIGNKETPFNKHPEDYSLFQLGVYNDNNGIVEPLAAPCQLGTALEFKDV